MVGSGIITNSGPILQNTQSYPALFFLWTLGGICAAIGAMALAEMATGIPRSGGDYVFVREAFGPAVGFVYGWAMLALGFAAPIALVAYTSVQYLAVPLGFADAPRLIQWGATLLITGFTLSHSLSYRKSAAVQGLTTSFKLGVLLLFAVSGFLGEGSFSHLGSSVPLPNVSFPKLSSGFILVLYAYTGWNAAAYLAGEMKNPSKHLPWCLVGGTLSVTLLYLLINLFYCWAFSTTQVASLTEGELSRLGELAVAKLLGKPAANWFSLLVSGSVVASLSAYVLTGPRIAFAMAKDGLFPSIAAKRHPKSQIPIIATCFQGLLAVAFLWSGTFEEVLTFASYGLTFLGMLVTAPLFVLRKRVTFQPTYRMPGYPYLPIFFLVASSSTLIGGAIEDPTTAIASLGSILLGLPLYYAFQKWVLPDPSPEK